MSCQPCPRTAVAICVGLARAELLSTQLNFLERDLLSAHTYDSQARAGRRENVKPDGGEDLKQTRK